MERKDEESGIEGREFEALAEIWREQVTEPLGAYGYKVLDWVARVLGF